MSDFFEKKQWDNYWSSHEKKEKIIDKIIGRMRTYFGDRYVSELKKIERFNGFILEVGSGSGYASRKISGENKVFTLDYSPSAGKFQTGEKMHIVADGFHVPLKSDQFDIVWNAGVLEHFEGPQGMLKEMIRVCKQGGTICVFVPSKLDLTGQLRLYGKEKLYLPSQLKGLLEEVGLKNTSTKVMLDLGGWIIRGKGTK